MQQNNYKHIALALLVGSSNAAVSFGQDCQYIPSTATTDITVTYGMVGGSFQSWGCAPIDPTYWLAGGQVSITATFAQTTDFPGIRVWGMNTDDVAAVSVNGAPYLLDSNSASIAPKVVCGISPGPDGVEFAGGNVVGSNSNMDGNYSYSDVTLHVNGVNSIMVTSLSGAGWVFAGVLVDCALGVQEASASTASPFPNPTEGRLFLPMTPGLTVVTITDATGALMMRFSGPITEVDLSKLAPGCYTMVRSFGSRQVLDRVMVM